jgi:signal transduction histidine kinase
MTAPQTHPLFFAALFWSASFAAASEQPRATASTPITTIAGAFARWPDLTTDNEPIQLEGVVTGMMPSGAFRLNDGELGIYVTRSALGLKLAAGERVVVTGVMRKGGFSPWLTPHAIRSLGPGTLPEARAVSFNVLASGAADNQWVEIVGVVRAVQVLDPPNFVGLEFGMEGGALRLLVNYDATAPFESLIDAAVRVRGVAAVNVDAHKRVVEPSFRVSSFSDITGLEHGHRDPFAQPIVPVSRLMRFTSLGGPLQHRLHTQGVVTRQLSDRTFFVRDGDIGLKIEAADAHSFKPGETIEAAGFPMMVDGIPVLQHAKCRAIGVAAPPPPAEPTLTTLLQGRHNSDLVRIRARLVDLVVAGENATLIFQTADQLFKGLLNLGTAGATALPARNSLVDVTGICIISELDDIWFYRPRSFMLLVANPADLLVVQAPPWWTPARLGLALSVTSIVLLAVVGWVWALRRQVERKRAVIQQQARHTAALEERSRIARELHDTLEQGLTGLSLQMKAMETDLADTPHPARSRLHFARQMLRQSRALARNAIRELRSETVPGRLEGLIDGLKRVAGDWNHSGALRVNLEISGHVRALPLRIEHHLLGIGTEAMTNSVKHGRAEAIDVRVNFGAGEISVSIKDNGVGFDPAQHLEQVSGCFGLLGMRERAREVRGEVRIESRPGQGTEVVVTAPIEPAPELESIIVGQPAGGRGLARASALTYADPTSAPKPVA